jgi:hypothetical protein
MHAEFWNWRFYVRGEAIAIRPKMMKRKAA